MPTEKPVTVTSEEMQTALGMARRFVPPYILGAFNVDSGLLARALLSAVAERDEARDEAAKFKASDHFWALETNYLKQIDALTTERDEAREDARGWAEAVDCKSSPHCAEEDLGDDRCWTHELKRVMAEASTLRTSRDTLREALETINETCDSGCGCDHQDEKCCAKVGEPCAVCIAWNALPARTALGGSNE